jgi:hypothetical protein
MVSTEDRVIVEWQRPELLPLDRPRSHHQPAPTQFGRRKLLTLLAAGTARVITVVTIGGISLARASESTKPSPLEVDDHHDSTSTTHVKKKWDGDRDGDEDSAVSFTNHADGQGSLLIHLPNGKFVACERACTHQGAWVNYDPTSGCSHVSGPGGGPLANVAITVNANGTITTG